MAKVGTREIDSTGVPRDVLIEDAYGWEICNLHTSESVAPTGGG